MSRNDGADIIPIWNWFRDRAVPSRLVRAMHMTKDFAYTNPAGNHHGVAGQWLVEHRDGSWPVAWDEDRLFEEFEICPNPRPETIMQPDSLEGPDQDGAPKKESA